MAAKRRRTEPNESADKGTLEEQVSVRVTQGALEKIEELERRIGPDITTRAQILRAALDRGLDALLKVYPAAKSTGR